LTNLLANKCLRVLVTGGAGFIGSTLVRRLLSQYNNCQVYNLDKYGYASDLSSIGNNPNHFFLKVDLANSVDTFDAVRYADPDLVMHLAAETHVDRSIDAPTDFIQSNVIGTFNLLEAIRLHWKQLSAERQKCFRFHHISTDEVFGSLSPDARFSELTAYDPRSPYSATKAASDHLVRSWYHTYGLPIVLTNCSNNYGPWQFPEKLIPVVILNALENKQIPIYGDGSQIRDWLFVEDHIEALLQVITSGIIGETYCIGGFGEKTNYELVHSICHELDKQRPTSTSYSKLITYTADRPGHDQRYSIDPTKIIHNLKWQPQYSLEEGLALTVAWYLKNLTWCNRVKKRSSYYGERLGLL